VNDDFGDVFGFFFAISGDSFTNPELVRYAEQLRRELVLVPGVGKVAIGGAIPSKSTSISRCLKWPPAASRSTSFPPSQPPERRFQRRRD
jgi:hypothetical protein